MSHATIHATLAARDVLTIPSPPVVIPNRLDTRETTVSRPSGLLAEIPFAELENRQGSPTSRLSSDGGRNERSAAHPQAEDVGMAAPRGRETGRATESSTQSDMEMSYAQWVRHSPL